jgi:hypothetical protein
MGPATRLADPEAIRLEKIIRHPSSLTLVVRATRAQPECPRCLRPSSRVHSYYVRAVADLPRHGVAVRLELRTRRFRCRDGLRTKPISCERLPRVVAHDGRKTARAEEALRLVGYLVADRSRLLMNARGAPEGAVKRGYRFLRTQTSAAPPSASPAPGSDADAGCRVPLLPHLTRPKRVRRR